MGGLVDLGTGQARVGRFAVLRGMVDVASTGDRLRRFRSNRPAVIATFVVAFLFLASVFGPLMTPDPTIVDLPVKFAQPSASHLLGTDHLGRDLLSRVLNGGRVSFLVAFVATVLAVVPAAAMGIAAGYFGGITDEIASRSFDVLLTFPSVLLAIVVVAALGPSLPSLIVAIAISDVPRYGRLFRALTLEVKEREFIASAVALGYSALRIMARHVFPNVAVAVMVIAAGSMGRVALAEASLSFLGAGIQPPEPSWGNMISQSQGYLQYYPLLALVPGIALTALTVAFSFIGDGLRDAFDIRDAVARVA